MVIMLSKESINCINCSHIFIFMPSRFNIFVFCIHN